MVNLFGKWAIFKIKKFRGPKSDPVKNDPQAISKVLAGQNLSAGP
jgi:hypothetical protein